MTKVLFPIAYLPPVSWIALAHYYKDVSIELLETYPKQTFRNRCIIATASGRLNLSVPVIRINGNHTKTADIIIDHSKNWQQLHWRSIETAYNKSPYFMFYRDRFEPIFFKKHEKLIELNRNLLEIVFKTLQIHSINLNFTSEYKTNTTELDFRTRFNPKSNPYQNITSNIPRYIQVFEEITGFLPDLTILDLIFNLGPEALPYLKKIQILKDNQ
jgi:hypothetical protein